MTETDTNEQRLDTRLEMYRTAEYSGKIQGSIYEAARQNGTEKDVSQFEQAVDEGWLLVYARATSAAHGWQIQSDNGYLTLADGAYPSDVGPLVFGNGWIMLPGAKWFHDPQLVHKIARLKERQQSPADRQAEREQSVLDSDDRLSPAETSRGRQMDGWWVFSPTGSDSSFIGRPEASAAYAQGYDDAKGDNRDEANAN